METQPEWAYIMTDGIPGELLLVFTLLIWLVFGLILMSDPKNRLNQRCFGTGMMFSVGALKEFLFYTLGPKLIHRGIWSEAFSQLLYSLLSATFYYLSMPAVVIFCLYFHRLDRTHPVLFRRLRLLVYLPPALLALIFPCTQTLALQSDRVFCLTVGLYNWCYGLIGTGILVHILMVERLSSNYRQRRLATVSLLVPLWFWLISAFPYHALGILNLSKMWQFNLIVMLFFLFYFLYHAFREGIWGIRFRRETYDWSSGNQALQKNAQYVGHALKNDLAKIEWCTDVLAEEGACGREVEILRRSASHLKQFISRTQLYSQDISLVLEECNVEDLFHELREEFNQSQAEAGPVQISFCDPEPLICDMAHLKEVLRNLITNSMEASDEEGQVVLTYRCQPRRRCAVITVADNGCGMDEETVKQLFEPYYTTKAGGENLGLGLYYCWNVMSAHGGSIRVTSQPGGGSVFSLLFPIKRRRKGATLSYGTNSDSGCGG